jgi:inhibitor of KinA
MRIEPLGDAAYILRDLDAPAYLIANWLNRKGQAGLIEAVASYDTVGLYVNSAFDARQLDFPENYGAHESRSHTIPVCYELGEDLESTAKRLNLTPDALVAHHTAQEYTCYAVGFCPGFGYLGYLPTPIQGVPRRESPRTRVQPGSLGITGTQTGVYPLARPGGWALIGRTPLTLVDVPDEYFPLEAGDHVTFQSIGLEEFRSLGGERL